jgi:hypothetical protein
MSDPLCVPERPRAAAASLLAACAFLAAGADGLCAQTRFDHLAKDHLPELRGNAAKFLWFDADGDSDLDALLIGENGSLLVQTGPLQFSARISGVLGSFRNRDGALADFDGDGDLDVVIARDSLNRLYLNSGGGNFVENTFTALGSNSFDARGVAAGDVDQDGDADIVFANASSADLVMRNNGAGLFAPAPTALPGSARSSCIALLDVDLDGDLDIVRGNDAADTELLLNDGAGAFTAAATPLPSDGGGALAVLPLDADGDGDMDLLLPNAAGGARLLLAGAGGAFTDASSWLPANLPTPQRTTLLDLDGDSDLDVFFTSTSGAVLLQNQGARFVDVSSRLPAVDGPCFGCSAADADGDGDPDLFVTRGRVQLYVNERGGREFVDASGAKAALVQAGSRLADIDGDGDLDLLTAPNGAVAFGAVLVNDGRGGFTDETAARWSPTGLQRAFYAFAVGDVDGDGDPDLVVGQSGQDRLWLNDGDGRFSEATAALLPVDADNTNALALADLDGDGDLDLAAANSLGPNRVWLNDGSGRFLAAPTALPIDAFWSNGIAAVDVDGDSDLDLVVADWNTQTGTQPRLYLNDGAATFADATAGRMPIGRSNDGGIAAGDVDQDGDVDLVMLGALLINDGAGAFTDATLLRLPGNAGLEPRLADFDDDGDLDLIGYQTLFLNDGAGNFTDDSGAFAGSGFFGSVPRPYALGDLDRDGDVDVVGSYDLFANLRRHLAAPLLPRLGAPFTLDVYGASSGAPADACAVLFLARRTLSRPWRLGGFGWLHANPLTLFAADLLPLPAGAGAASRTWTVPSSSALAGLDFCAQALVLHGRSPATWRFTNVVEETIVR